MDVLEVEPQTVWHRAPGVSATYRMPERAASYFKNVGLPILVHGVGGPVGGTSLPPPAFLRAFADTVVQLAPAWASEHLSFNRVPSLGGDGFTGMMLPQLQTALGATAAAQTIRAVAAHLPVPFAIETPVNYLRPWRGEMADGEFVARVALEADCGILLDLHNVWTNEQNGRQPAREFLQAIPLERVWELHLGGGEMHNGYWLDAHSGTVPDEVTGLAEEIIPRLPNMAAVVFEILPTFVERLGIEGLVRQMVELRRLWNRRSPATSRLAKVQVAQAAPHAAGEEEPDISPSAWEETLGGLALGLRQVGDREIVRALGADSGLEVIRDLLRSFRTGAIVDTLGLTAKLLMAYGGTALLERLTDEYVETTPPRLFASEEATAFAAFLRTKAIPVPYLDEVLELDQAKNLAVVTGEPREVWFEHDPQRLLGAVARGTIPTDLPSGQFSVIVTP